MIRVSLLLTAFDFSEEEFEDSNTIVMNLSLLRPRPPLRPPSFQTPSPLDSDALLLNVTRFVVASNRCDGLFGTDTIMNVVSIPKSSSRRFEARTERVIVRIRSPRGKQA